MKTQVLCICSKNSGTRNTLNKFAKMIDFFGLEIVDQPPKTSDFAIVINYECIGTLSSLPVAKTVLVYNCRNNSEMFKVVKRDKGSHYHVSADREITRQFSGLSIPACASKNAYAFSSTKIDGNLIQLDNDPIFVHEERNGSHWFYLTTDDVVDLDTSISDDFTLDSIFEDIVPYAMFFKYLNKETDSYYANLIVDDPSLIKCYGFIDYKKIANTLSDNGLALTIAFIPWNYRKSQRKTIELFLANRDKLSICVHGCDHTSGEFATTDDTALDWKICLARKRMERHKIKFGLPYDNAIVFPQGAFSAESMRALQRHGFTAAVNSTIFARNYCKSLKVSDLISPATSYYGLPLLLRRYPQRIEDFAYDLFFGRPVLIVQHSWDFAEGWDNFLVFAKKLKALEPQLKWVPLGRIIEKVCPASQQIQKIAEIAPECEDSCRYTAKTWFEAALRRTMCEIRDRIIYKNKYLRTGLANRVGYIVRKIEDSRKGNLE